MLSWKQQRILRYLIWTAVPFLLAIGIISILTIRDDSGEIAPVWSDWAPPGAGQMISRVADTVSPYRLFEREIRVPGRYGRMSREVLGFYPYWMEKSRTNVRADLLTHIAYFSYEVDPATGDPVETHSWPDVPLFKRIGDDGPAILLVVTNFGGARNRMFLENAAARGRLMDNLVSNIEDQRADGINIDFEVVPRSLRDTLTSFMEELAFRLRTVMPSAHLSIDLPGIDRESAFDVKKLARICDYLVVMGYDYYHQGSRIAGPVAPLDWDGTWRKEHIRSAVTYLISNDVDPKKILLGLPLYGYEWKTVSDTAGSAALKGGKPRYYSAIRIDSAFGVRREDHHSKSTWSVVRDGKNWRQIWFEDSASLARKYRFVDSADLGGIALWALGYDGARQEIWNGILEAFLKVDTIRFDRHFPLSTNLKDGGWRGVSFSSGTALRRRRAGTSLELTVRDSLETALQWRVPIPFHDYLVLPREGAILFSIRCREVPRASTLRCIVRFRGRLHETAAQRLESARSWREFSFPLSSLPDSVRREFRSGTREHATLHAIILEAPGNSGDLSLLIDKVTAKAFLLPRESVVEECEQMENRVRLTTALHGDELREISIQRFDESSSRWITRERRKLRLSMIQHITLFDSLDRKGEIWYRVLAVDRQGNRLVMDTRRIWNGPSFSVMERTVDQHGLLVRFERPPEEDYVLEIVTPDGAEKLDIVSSRSDAGQNTIACRLPELDTNGIYYIRMRTPEMTIVRKLLRLR